MHRLAVALAIGSALAASPPPAAKPAGVRAQPVPKTAAPPPVAPLAERSFAPPEHQIEELDGQVYIWPFMQAKWTELRIGMRVPEGTLVQTEGPARIIVRRRSKIQDNLDEEVLSLDMGSSTIFRMGEHLGRDMFITSFTFTSQKGMWRKGAALERGKVALVGLHAAWERIRQISALLTDISDSSSELIVPREPFRVRATTMSRGTLDVKVPTDGTVFVLDDFPADVPLVWEARNDDGAVQEVDVRLRHASETEAPVFVRTSRRALPLSIARPGVYKLLVASPSLGMQSQEIAISVESTATAASLGEEPKEEPKEESKAVPAPGPAQSAQ